MQLHAADLRLQLLGKLGGDLLLADKVNNDGKHEVNQVDSSLDDVFLGLRETLRRVPASTLQEEVMDAAIQLTVKLAEVLAAIALGNTVLLTLVFRVRGDGAALALTAAELLQGSLAVNVLRRNQCHDLGLGEIVGPFRGNTLLSGE